MVVTGAGKDGDIEEAGFGGVDNGRGGRGRFNGGVEVNVRKHKAAYGGGGMTNTNPLCFPVRIVDEGEKRG